MLAPAIHINLSSAICAGNTNRSCWRLFFPPTRSGLKTSWSRCNREAGVAKRPWCDTAAGL